MSVTQTIVLKHISTIEVFSKKHGLFVSNKESILRKQSFLDKLFNDDLSKQKVGFVSLYDIFKSNVYTEEELKTGKFEGIFYLVQNDKVFFKPYLTISVDGIACRCIEFDTVDEANTYHDELRILIKNEKLISITFLNNEIIYKIN